MRIIMLAFGTPLIRIVIRSIKSTSTTMKCFMYYSLLWLLSVCHEKESKRLEKSELREVDYVLLESCRYIGFKIQSILICQSLRFFLDSNHFFVPFTWCHLSVVSKLCKIGLHLFAFNLVVFNKNLNFFNLDLFEHLQHMDMYILS